MKYTARRSGRNVNVSPSHPLKEFALLAGALLAIVVGVYLTLGLVVDLMVPRLSVNFEKKLAAVWMGRFAKMEPVTGATQYLQVLVDRLRENCAPLSYDITVHAVRSDTVNAAALPGGHLVVFTGLLAKMTSENELAFVLAHEMGHYAHRDHLRGLGRALLLTTASTLLLGVDNSVTGMIGQGLTLTELNFSRKQETRADEYALNALFCHYGHVADATAFFGSIAEDGDPGRFGHYFASHPENRRRIDHLNGLAREHGYPTGTPLSLPSGLTSHDHSR